MSDASPLTTFHRAARSVEGVGCVLDPWLANRSHPCPAPPAIGLEPMDCAVNKFTQLPVRFRGAVMSLPYLDLDAVRADPRLPAMRAACASRGSFIDLGSVFDDHGLSCDLDCGAEPYCGTPADPMDMNMSGCYGDYDLHDPGYIAPSYGTVNGTLVPGINPTTTAPTCPAGSSSAGSSCVPIAFNAAVMLYYVTGCLWSRRSNFSFCDGAVTETWLPDVMLGCDCCPQSSSSSPPERSSSSSSESSSSAGSSGSSSSVSSSSLSSSSEESSSSSSSSEESSSTSSSALESSSSSGSSSSSESSSWSACDTRPCTKFGAECTDVTYLHSPELATCEDGAAWAATNDSYCSAYCAGRGRGYCGYVYDMPFYDSVCNTTCCCGSVL